MTKPSLWGTDWTTREAQDALKIVLRHKLNAGPGLSEFDIADFLFFGYEHSFWYTQAKSYAESGLQGAQAFLELIDSGHTPEGGWWNIERVWPDKDLRARKLADMGRFLGIALALKTEGRTIVSNGFGMISQFVFGKEWRQIVAACAVLPDTARKSLRSSMEDDFYIKPCISPDCDNPVDLRKRKSGACCREHMNFECCHSECVAKAQERGWGKYTHRHGTKIAQEHWAWRKGGPNDPETTTLPLPGMKEIASNE